MAILKLNSSTVGGMKSALNVVEITQAQYDALSEEEKMSENIFRITDKDYPLDAKQIAYGDGSVDGAIGELAETVDDLKKYEIKIRDNSYVIRSDGLIHISNDGSINVLSAHCKTQPYRLEVVKVNNAWFALVKSYATDQIIKDTSLTLSVRFFYI